MAGRVQRQQELVFKTWGGRREGAGRPPKHLRSSEPHKKRPRILGSQPLHVTVRVVPAVGSLRKHHMFKALREATIAVAVRDDFRIVHVSIQSNHVHFIVEAAHKTALAKGMQAFQISAARHLNAAVAKRTGKLRKGRVFSDRYHARALKTPREVRNAIAYVLNNWRRHDEHRAQLAKSWNVDPYSSGILFTGWKELEHALVMWQKRATYQELIVWLPRTWLLREGWRRHGLIRFDEVPGPLDKRVS